MVFSAAVIFRSASPGRGVRVIMSASRPTTRTTSSSLATQSGHYINLSKSLHTSGGTLNCKTKSEDMEGLIHRRLYYTDNPENLGILHDPEKKEFFERVPTQTTSANANLSSNPSEEEDVVNNSIMGSNGGGGGGGNNDFPAIHLCPKNETGVLNFLAKNPESDGRGVVIAIFDSGVDPGAPGLRITSTGLPKIIERYDCSGAGDVDTSKVVTVDSGTGTITGITGRKLKVPSTWKNPSGNYHIGVKPVYELYTAKVKERIELKRKEANWDQPHRLLTSEVNRKLSQEQNGNKSTDNLTPLEKLAKEDLEASLEAVQNLEKNYKDFGPVLDCIVWNDGTEWRVCLSQDGDLANGIILGEFKLRQEFQPLTKEDQMNISVNVYDGGNTLEIVGMCGSHGTHVSSIAAGYFPENPCLNGVAPGAQIIAYTIGDGRLGSMETGTALVRAMSHVMHNADRIHVINMSYGEHAHWSTEGRLGELMKEVVEKHGVTWVASAGNHGPALSTVGSPPWIKSNSIIGVAAYVSPEMMSAEYSLRQKLPGMPYSWSSRGPTLDGELGVSVSAPGGAITSVPNFTLRSAQLMNGTSMAAPHVAGCVALILNSAIRKGVKWSPFSVKKALELSAQPVPQAEPYAQGFGLVQVEKALQTLEMLSSVPERDVRFNISVTSGAGGGSSWPLRGIYIRDPPLEKSREYSISVEPVFFKEESVEPEAKINFRMNLCLISTVPWIQVPSYFDLANIQRSFNAKVDVEGLPKGYHFGKIEAYDSSCMEKGPVFNVFATVIKPEILTVSPMFKPTIEFPNAMYEPGLIKRYFVSVPIGSSWAALSLKMIGNPGTTAESFIPTASARFLIHTMILTPGSSCKSDEHYKMVSLNPLEEALIPFRVVEGRVMEVVIARWWAEPTEAASLSSSLTFRSVYLDRPEVNVSAGDSVQRLTIQNAFATEDVQPAAVLKHQVSLLRPTDSKIVSLRGPRDSIPPERIIYQLENTYSFSVSRATEVTINCCLLSDTLYESEYESQMWQLYDKNKRFLGCGDAYPSKWNIKLEKGDYLLRLHVRHEKREALEKLQQGNSGGNGSSTSNTWNGDSHVPNLPVLLSMKLPSSINLDVFQSQYATLDFKGSSKGTGWSSVLKRQSNLNAYLSTSIADKNLKTLPGSSTHYLQGTFTIHKDETGKKLVIYPLKLSLPDSPPKAKSPPSKDTTKTKLEEMNEQLRDIRINWLSKLDADESKKLYETLVEQFDAHIPLHVARLQALDSGSASSSDNSPPSPGNGDASSPRSTDSASGSDSSSSSGGKKPKTPETCKEMIAIADKILGMIDQPALLAFYGTRSSSQSESPKVKQAMDKQRTAVIEALSKKGLAIAELLKMKCPSDSSQPITVEALDEILFDLQKYVDILDSRIMEFAYQHALARGHYSRALKILRKYIETEPNRWTNDVDQKFVEVFKALNWNHCVWLWENTLSHRYPQDFRPF